MVTMWIVSLVILLYASCEVLSDEVLLKGEVTNNEATSDIEKKIEHARKYLSSLANEKEDWIDPYDMIPMKEIHSKSVKHDVSTVSESNVEFDFRPLFSDIKGEAIGPNSISKDDSDDYVSENNGNLLSNDRHQICVLDSIYISRWLKKLISKIESESEVEPTALNIPFDSESLVELKAMSVAKTLDIADLDEIMCNLIGNAKISRREAYDWKGNTNLIIKAVIITCICLLVGYALYTCWITAPIYTLLSILFCLNVFWHWMHLYQKQIAAKHSVLSSMQIPSECEKVDLGILEQIQVYFKSFFVTGDCLKYYEALMVNPIWEVSLSVAVSESFAATFFQPLYSASKAINASVKLLFADLGFISTIILIIFLFIFLIMFCGYKLKFPFFMGSLEPGGIVYNHVEEVKSVRKPSTLQKLNQSLDALLNILNVKESTSNSALCLPSGSTKVHKSDNIPICSSNDLPSKSCHHKLIKRSSNKDNNEEYSNLKAFKSSSKTFPRNTDNSFVSESTKKSDNDLENMCSSCSCSLEDCTVKRTEIEEENECECVIDRGDHSLNESHIEVQESCFDQACAKCELDSLKQISTNENDCIECVKDSAS